MNTKNKTGEGNAPRGDSWPPAMEHTLDECRDMGCGCREERNTALDERNQSRQDFSHAAQELARVKAQRDELLAAAREVEAHSYANDLTDSHGGYTVDSDAMDRLCFAMGKIGKRIAKIAKAEGSKQ